MKPSFVHGLALFAAAAAFGCAGEPAPPSPPVTVVVPPVGVSVPPTTPAGATVATGDFGVPACDQYMHKYMACVDSKVPEQARAMMRQQLEQTRTQWKQAASTPQGRDGLKMACEQAEASAKQALSVYGCAW